VLRSPRGQSDNSSRQGAPTRSSTMSASRCVSSLSLRQTATPGGLSSSSCIRPQPLRCLRTIRNVPISTISRPLRDRPFLFCSFPRLHLQKPCTRTLATVVRNQKYNEDNVPLTLEITPSCVSVPIPLLPVHADGF